MSNELDGKTHIAISSKGETELGRLLSEGGMENIDTKWGVFKTFSGYSAFLRTGCKHPEVYRELTQAQAVLQIQRVELVQNVNTSRLLQAAIYKHLLRNPQLQEMLTSSTLPFSGPVFLVKYFEKMRTKFKNGVKVKP